MEVFKTPEGCASVPSSANYLPRTALAYFGKNISPVYFRYFFQDHVKGKDDGNIVPKRRTAEAVRSRLKSEIQNKFKMDIFDPIILPESWKPFVTTIVAAGRNKKQHHEEVHRRP